jgi:threonine/homoserine/homoserine lactone efflux protein
MAWQAIGSILGQAVGIAISPGAIIAVILVLFSAKARLNSLLFLLGWVVGVAVPFVAAVLISNGGDVSTDSGASNGQAIAQIVLGALFFFLALRQWRGRPREGQPAKPNKLFEKLADMGPGLSVGIAVLLTALNPKNLALALSAAGETAQHGVSGNELVVVTIVFVAIATIGVATPVIVSVAMGERSATILGEWRTWMTRHDAAIMIVLFVILGAKMAGSGITSLAS